MPPKNRQKLNLNDLLHQVSETRKLLAEERRRGNRCGKSSRDPGEYIVYTTHISRIHALPSEELRYKAVSMGEPEEMPEDIQMYISETLNRIREESRQ
jgi:hypothetical protein